MFKTNSMRLVDLMILRQDIDRVLEYLGKKANFQIRNSGEYLSSPCQNPNRETLDQLHLARNYLGIADIDEYRPGISIPSDADAGNAAVLLASVDSLRTRDQATQEKLSRVASAYDEARAFANLKVSYSELEHLTFLSFRIGKIDPAVFGELSFAVGERAVIVPLGSDRSRILAVASKKGRFALDTELKRFSFVPVEIPKEFTGVPDDMLDGLKNQLTDATRDAENITLERSRFADVHSADLVHLLQVFSLGAQVCEVRGGLEATQLVYRVTGWISADESRPLMKDIDDLAGGRVAIRIYLPSEVPSVSSGNEKVPVRFRHGSVVRSFERMIFSYGAPLYGTVDPTPLVAFFFTLLFGIMFGDVGQGFVLFLLGLSLVFGWLKALNRWRHFGPLFIVIGCASMVMGFITGEFFANGSVLVPFSRWVTGHFGEPRDKILELMPSKGAIDKLLYFFGFTLAIGFIINSLGLVINIVNQFSLKRPARAIFSKTGICGALFFWYVVFAAIRIATTGGPIAWYDIACVSVPLALLFLATPITRFIEGDSPVLENGFFSAIIEGIVELLEIVSTNISNSVSFLRVGAFALSHAVLSYIVFTMSTLVGGSLSAGGLLIGIFGNAIIICLEGLIVAIQVVRLQYYEFFSKFFTETGREFKPFRFKYKNN